MLNSEVTPTMDFITIFYFIIADMQVIRVLK